MRRMIVAAVAAAMTLALAAPAIARAPQAEGAKPGGDSIFAIAGAAGFTELAGAIQYVDEELGAGLEELFKNGTDQYTVFAPTNDAFENLYTDLGVDDISDVDAETVLNVLLYHVTEGRRAANSVLPPRGERTITPLLGVTFTVDTAGVIDDVDDRGARIVGANISASNGIVHVINEVILPIDIPDMP